MSPRLRPAPGGDDHSTGPDDAPVTLVEYGDFECPSCGMAYPIVKAVQQQMGNRLRFIFRNFPLAEVHPHAEHAAESAEAAAVQGKFWEMHDILFEHQSRLDDEHLVRYASEIGADPEQVAGALASGAFVDQVEADFMSGVRSGVNGTPTFFIDGERWDGPWMSEAEFIRALGTSAE